MKNRHIIPLLLCSLITLGGCTELLDIEQKSVVGIENFYETDEDAEEAIAYAYRGFAGAMGNVFFFKNMLDGDCWTGGGDRNDNTSYEGFNEFTFTTQNSNLSGYFSALYTMVYRSNLIIENFSPESDTKTRVIAEAKFFRALAYFELVTFWGNPPLITKTAKSETDYTPGNGNTEDIWGLIETDLTEALGLNILPEKTGLNDDQTGVRITKQTAQAMLGKVYLWRGKYSEAATILDQVIDSNLYDLYDGDYADILRSSTDFNKESLLEVNNMGDPSNPYNTFTMWNLMIGWRTPYLNDSAWFLMMNQGFLEGWGFANPTKDIYDQFVAWEGVNSYRRVSTIKTYDEVSANGVTVKDGMSLYGHEGYFLWKQRMSSAEAVPNGWACYDTNIRVMRFAEVLLLAAEAHLNDGNSGKALTYVNRIRTRAQLPDLPSVTMAELKIEKRLELCFEGLRYQDLIRWGDAATVLADRGKYVPTFGYYGSGSFGVNQNAFTNPAAGFKAKHALMPFPYSETSVNKNIVQHEAWR